MGCGRQKLVPRVAFYVCFPRANSTSVVLIFFVFPFLQFSLHSVKHPITLRHRMFCSIMVLFSLLPCPEDDKIESPCSSALCQASTIHNEKDFLQRGKIRLLSPFLPPLLFPACRMLLHPRQYRLTQFILERVKNNSEMILDTLHSLMTLSNLCVVKVTYSFPSP